MTEDTGARAPDDAADADTAAAPDAGAAPNALEAGRDATAQSHVDERVRGWGGNPDAPPLSDNQVARLQEHDEPVAGGDFGAALRGDLGNAEVADEATDTPETVEPDTSLGHEGGQRYEDFATGAQGPEGADGPDAARSADGTA